jgi:hypothetical protein
MGIGENTTGIIFGPSSFNAKAEEIVHPYGISDCTVAVHTGVGGVFVNGGDGGSSGIDFLWGGNADPTEIKNYTSEGSGQFFSGVGGGGGSFPVLFENNHSAGGSYAAPNKCDVDLNSSGTLAMTATLINNGWDAAVVPNHPAVCGNQQSHNVFINNVYQAWPTAGPTGFPYEPGKNYGADYLVINGGRLRVGTANTWSVWDAGYGFIGVHGTEIPGLGYSNDAGDCYPGAGLCIGRNSEFLGTGHLRLSSIWPIWPNSVSCSVVGKAGSANWAMRIIPKNGAGQRGIWYGFGGNYGCFHAPATLTRSNYVHLSWPWPLGAAKFDVVFMNPSAPGVQGKLMATVSTNSVDITVNPVAPWDYTFPTYDETAGTSFWGAGAYFQAPISVRDTAGKGWIPAVRNDGSDKVQIGDATHAASAPGGIAVATSGPQPRCDATHRGWFWFAAGGAGVKDTVQVCAKDASNTFAWRAVY